MGFLTVIENKVNNELNKYPAPKRVIKRIYQILFYTFSKKIQYRGDINKLSPDDNKEYFFGYYDKSPWDKDNERILCLRVNCAYKEVAPKEDAEIILINGMDRNDYKVIAKTRCWNVQQGCMLQWLGPDYKSKIIYNDFRDGKYCSIVLSLDTMEEKILKLPVYSVSDDGKFALSLDFSRLHRLRKGYGYSNLPDQYESESLPDDFCIWKLMIEDNIVIPLLKYTDFYNFETRKEMNNAVHKVNHIMINPSGTRFMVLHRWRDGQRKYTRLVTCDCNGEDMYNLSDDDMVSHCYWKNDKEILAFANKQKEGNGYFLMLDHSKSYVQFWEDLKNDGHPSYSHDRNYVITDSYPNRKRMANIKLLREDGFCRIIAEVFAPFKYDNDTRCDLHPRWNRSDSMICFDSVFEGKRGLYSVNLQPFKEDI